MQAKLKVGRHWPPVTPPLKMYATNLAMLVTDGQFKVQECSSRLQGPGGSDKILGKNDLTACEILEHQAGFPPDPGTTNRKLQPCKT